MQLKALPLPLLTFSLLKPLSLHQTLAKNNNNKMQTLFLFLFLSFLFTIFFEGSHSHKLAFIKSKPFIFLNNYRRILHEPFVPLNSFPPSEPPLHSPPSTKNTKHPFSTTIPTDNNPTQDQNQNQNPNPNPNPNPNQDQNQSPFFPNYPLAPPPPPPSLLAFASFPANISSLILPHTQQPTTHSSNKLLPVALSATAVAVVAVAISVFLYFRRRLHNRRNSTGDKTLRSDSGVELFSRNAEPAVDVGGNTTDFLYLGTVVNSRGTDETPPSRGGASVYRKLESPELRPLPPLARLPEPPSPPPRSDNYSDEEDEEFYSPRGSSLGGRESSGGTESSSRRAFSAVVVNRSNKSSSISCSSSSFGSPEQSHSMSLSPPASSSPRRTQQKSPETSPSHNQHVEYRSSSSSFSSSRSTPERDFDEEKENSSLSTNVHASLEERFMEKDENASLSEQKPRISNASSSIFSLPSSPEKMMKMMYQGFDQSPRMSSVSDGSKLPGLSSVPLSPALLSSPETERGGFSCNSNQWGTFPSQRKHWEIPVVSKQKNASASPPPPPPPLPQQRQRRHWEMSRSSAIVYQPRSNLRPPELAPPSRPFVLQNQMTNEYVGETEESSKPKLKPLHWDKVRPSSEREMVWDQMNSMSFKLNEEMIETLFVANTANQKPKDAAPRSVLPLPNQEGRVLDPKKSQNIAILLKALNVTIEGVCEALLEGSSDRLGAELLESLLKMAPSKEEERKLKEHKEDSPTKLDVAEKFLKALLDIPFTFKRVEAMLYMVNFQSEVVYLRKSFQTLEAACEELRNCRMFLKLLEAVLKTGNRMNIGTNRGDAEAFKLDTLLKLADVKGADGKTTLLHFVVQEIIRTEGTRLSGTNQTTSTTLTEDVKCRRLGLQVVSNLSSDLSNVKRAATMDSEVLSSDVLKLSKGTTNLAEAVQLIEKVGFDESSRKFTESVNNFIKMAEEEIVKIQAHESVALTLVKEITEYFHGNLAKEEAHPFRIFLAVRDFLVVLDRVCKEVGMVNERTTVSSANKFPVPVNPMLPQPLPGLHGRKDCSNSSDDEFSSP